MPKPGLRLLILLGLAACAATSALAGRPELTLADKENPHGDMQACGSCHGNTASPALANFLPASCTECHPAEAHARRIHIPDVPADDVWAPIPPDVPLGDDGRSHCITCHNPCPPGSENVIDRANRDFLRDGPYIHEEDFCYSCHRKDAYQSFNPHHDVGLHEDVAQVLGDNAEKTRLNQRITRNEGVNCMVCHKPGPDGNEPTTELVNLDIFKLCMACHGEVHHERKHVGKSIHTDRFAHDPAEHLSRAELENGVRLPLARGEFISCSTCHLPNLGCRPSAETGDLHPDAKSALLRLSKEQICHACHDL